MNKLSNEEAARRRAETARMPRCHCGNIAGVGHIECSACRSRRADEEYEVACTRVAVRDIVERICNSDRSTDDIDAITAMIVNLIAEVRS